MLAQLCGSTWKNVCPANDGVHHATTPAARVAASRRFAALAIQAFQARHRTRPPVVLTR